MIIELIIVAITYILGFFFFSKLKSINSFWDKLIFCQTCVTFFSILCVLFIYYLFTGIQVLPLALLLGMSITGFGYKFNSDFDRLKEKKINLKDEPYKNFWKEFFYQSRLFWSELILFLIGLIILNVFKLWTF